MCVFDILKKEKYTSYFWLFFIKGTKRETAERTNFIIRVYFR